MKNSYIMFDILEEGEQPSPMHSYMRCHMIFDVNMDFTRKAHYFDTGCHAHNFDDSCYAGVVSCDSVCIAFTYADINGIGIMAADIQNNYLASPCSENYWTIFGPKFGSEHEGKSIIL